MWQGVGVCADQYGRASRVRKVRTDRAMQTQADTVYLPAGSLPYRLILLLLRSACPASHLPPPSLPSSLHLQSSVHPVPLHQPSLQPPIATPFPTIFATPLPLPPSPPICRCSCRSWGPTAARCCHRRRWPAAAPPSPTPHSAHGPCGPGRDPVQAGRQAESSGVARSTARARLCVCVCVAVPDPPASITAVCTCASIHSVPSAPLRHLPAHYSPATSPPPPPPHPHTPTHPSALTVSTLTQRPPPGPGAASHSRMLPSPLLLASWALSGLHARPVTTSVWAWGAGGGGIP